MKHSLEYAFKIGQIVFEIEKIFRLALFPLTDVFVACLHNIWYLVILLKTAAGLLSSSLNTLVIVRPQVISNFLYFVVDFSIKI